VWTEHRQSPLLEIPCTTIWQQQQQQQQQQQLFPTQELGAGSMQSSMLSTRAQPVSHAAGECRAEWQPVSRRAAPRIAAAVALVVRLLLDRSCAAIGPLGSSSSQ
jgi:hypothetical protein